MSFIGIILCLLLWVRAVRSEASCRMQTFSSASAGSGKAPIDSSTLTPMNQPKLSAMNGSAFESWVFDGVALGSFAGISIGFYRDPSYVPLGISPFWVTFNPGWPNGKYSGAVLLADNSTIEWCSNGTTRGTWLSETMRASFVLDQYRLATVEVVGKTMQNQTVDGKYHISSLSTPRYADGATYPSANASQELGPLMYWSETVPTGAVQVSARVDNQSLVFDGIGGLDRNWGAYHFEQLAKRWWFVRTRIGPYSLVMWRYESAIDHRTRPLVFLEHQEKPIFRSEVNGSSVDFALQYDGTTHGSYDDNSTGYTIRMKHETDVGNQWMFKVMHKNIIYETQHGFHNQYSRFVSEIRGGAIGGETYSAVGLCDQWVIDQVRNMTKDSD